MTISKALRDGVMPVSSFPWTIYHVYGRHPHHRETLECDGKVDEFFSSPRIPIISGVNRMGNNYGDWLSINANTPKGHSFDRVLGQTMPRLMADMADAVGRTADARKVPHSVSKTSRPAFQREFHHPGRPRDCRSLAFAMKTGVVPPAGHDTARGQGETPDRLPAGACPWISCPRNSARQRWNNLIARIDAQGGHLSTGFPSVSAT